jgi:hypothetical protein
MRSSVRTIVLALGLVIGSGAPAHALNFCFNPGFTDNLHNSLAVAVKFHKPHTGSCSPITGFDIGFGDYRSVFGTACLNSAGDLLHVNYVTSGVNLISMVVNIDLPYPSLLGGLASVDSGDASGSWKFASSNNGHANPCIPQAITIP